MFYLCTGYAIRAVAEDVGHNEAASANGCRGEKFMEQIREIGYT